MFLCRLSIPQQHQQQLRLRQRQQLARLRSGGGGGGGDKTAAKTVAFDGAKNGGGRNGELLRATSDVVTTVRTEDGMLCTEL